VQAFPQALLQELLAVATGWQPSQRVLAHELFGAVLPAAECGLADSQTHSVLSALWHEVRPGLAPCLQRLCSRRRCGGAVAACQTSLQNGKTS
jgi:hypothetical protein